MNQEIIFSNGLTRMREYCHDDGFLRVNLRYPEDAPNRKERKDKYTGAMLRQIRKEKGVGRPMAAE